MTRGVPGTIALRLDEAAMCEVRGRSGEGDSGGCRMSPRELRVRGYLTVNMGSLVALDQAALDRLC